MGDYPHPPSDAKALKSHRCSGGGIQVIKFLYESTGSLSSTSEHKELSEPEAKSSKLFPNRRGKLSHIVNFLDSKETGYGYNSLRECWPCNVLKVWDNDYIYQILGSKTAMEKEEAKRKQLSHFIIHPYSRAR